MSDFGSDFYLLTRTPLLSTRRKVEDQGWQRREGREEGGSRTWI